MESKESQARASSIDTADDEVIASASEERIFVATQWQLMWWRFRKHKMAMVAAVILIGLYLVALLPEFMAPYDPQETRKLRSQVQPTRIRFVDQDGKFGLRPFIYGIDRVRDPDTLRLIYTPNPEKKRELHFFVRGHPYKFIGLIPSDIHLFGVDEADDGEEGGIFIMGTDLLGRDVFSRMMYGTRISLSIGLIGITFSFFFGITLGGLSGYYGGTLDMIIQRLIEFLRSVPSIPLWMALSAALPATWPPLRVYFGITVILSFLSWTGLARIVRGRFLALREEDFIMAARLAGSNELRIIFRHMVPSFTSYIIASLTLSVPGMILSETSLSFLGLGLRPPVISWGVMLQGGQNLQAVAQSPWLLSPGFFVVVTVLAFNFLGDGLRDAADPYSR